MRGRDDLTPGELETLAVHESCVAQVVAQGFDETEVREAMVAELGRLARIEVDAFRAEHGDEETASLHARLLETIALVWSDDE